jgi:hypothetical protein
MGIGASIFLIALGAILAFAVDISTSGIDLNTIGVILMVVGVVGLGVTLAVLNGGAWYGGRRTRVVDDAYVDEPAPAARPRVDAYVDEPAPAVRRRVVRRREVI